MKNFKNKKTLQIVLLVAIAVVTLGIGYAAISAVNLIINGNASASVNQDNFKVHFTQAQAISGSTGVSGTSTIDSQDDTKAMFDVTGLTKVGDYAETVYTVRNDSNGIGAEITLNLESSNTEYFKVTETIQDNKLQAGEETIAKVKVEMIKTPITDSVSTSITATLTASPLEYSQASGGEEKTNEYPVPDPYIYTINNTNDIYINTDITDGIRTFNSFAAAKSEFGHPAAIAHDVEDGKITASYVAFEKNNKVYYLKGRINDNSVYETNIATIKEAFGEKWSDYCVTSGMFNCTYDSLVVFVNGAGLVRVSGSDWTCSIDGSTGIAKCSN